MNRDDTLWVAVKPFLDVSDKILHLFKGRNVVVVNRYPLHSTVKISGVVLLFRAQIVDLVIVDAVLLVEKARYISDVVSIKCHFAARRKRHRNHSIGDVGEI